MAPPGVNATASARRRSTAIRRAARFRSVKYAILMYAAPSHTRGMTESELDVIARKHAKLRDELTASGELAGGAGLVLPNETTVLRQGPDEPLAREGPLSGRGDDEEHLTAYYEVNCETLDRAREIGTYVLDHHVTSVEIRRIHDTAEKRG
jgi:hypothetical protein